MTLTWTWSLDHSGANSVPTSSANRDRLIDRLTDPTKHKDSCVPGDIPNVNRLPYNTNFASLFTV